MLHTKIIDASKNEKIEISKVEDYNATMIM